MAQRPPQTKGGGGVCATISSVIGSGIRAARARSVAVDELVASLIAALGGEGRAAAVALGSYGRQQLTPASEIELLVLHDGGLTSQQVTEAVWYPLFERKLQLEPALRSVAEYTREVQHSTVGLLSLLDARLIAGERSLFDELAQNTTAPLRHDRVGLRRRVAPLVQRRHAGHPAVTVSAVPDVLNGRGGLRDLQALHWLDPSPDQRIERATDFLLTLVSTAEEQLGHAHHRLTPRVQDRVAPTMGYASADALMADVYSHARWIAFALDGALSQPHADRSFGLSLSIRRGQLIGERLPPLERVPTLGLRVAHLIGFAPPARAILDWAVQPGPPVSWDEATRHQFWLLLRAADWRSWTFLDTTGLLGRYVPEWSSIARRRSGTGARDFALDTHSFLALRRLHEWLDTGDAFAKRLWATLRHRDWVYLAVLLHECSPPAGADIAIRCGLLEDGVATVEALVADHHLLADVATQRDLHDEDLLLDIAARIGSQQRLRMLFLVSIAHALAAGGDASSPWRLALLRRLFGLLDTASRSPGEVGARRQRSVEQHRERLVDALTRRSLPEMVPMVGRLPRRYLLAHSAAFVARHLKLAAGEPVREGEVRLRAERHRRADEWDLLVVARDRPGLLATMAGVLALRGATVLAADAATSADGLVLDVFTVGSAYGAPLDAELWPRLEHDLHAALDERLPLDALLASVPNGGADDGPVSVNVDNAASQVFTVVEVRAPDRVGLLYRITRALHDLGLDIHHAKVATYPDGALDVFYVWDLSGNKLDPDRACAVTRALSQRLRG
jgi:[protein-PII] uridylyltransferase